MNNAEGSRVRLADGAAVSFGLVAPPDARTVAALERGPARSLWVGGHVSSPNGTGEAVVALARLVAQTTTIVCGTAVLLLPLYPPALVAKQLADLDQYSGGRLCVGLGIGGEYAADYRACEVPLRTRGTRLDEGIAVMRRAWLGTPFEYSGRFYRLENVRITPRPIQPGGPPLIFAGRSEAAARRAALVGDGWMPYLVSPRRYAELAELIRETAAAAGRHLTDFLWLLYAPVSVAARPADAPKAVEAAAAYLSALYRQPFTELVPRVALAGDQKWVGDRIAEYAAAGVAHIVAMPAPRRNHEQQADLLEAAL